MFEVSPCTLYNISVVPITRDHQLLKSIHTQIITKEFHPKPVKRLAVTEVGSSYLKFYVEIFKVDNICGTNVIEIKCNNLTTNVNADNFKSTFYAVVLEGLQPHTEYRCSSKVKNNIGESKSTNTVVYRTAYSAPQTPFNIRSTVNDEKKSVDLEWDVDNSTSTPNFYRIIINFEETLNEKVENCLNNFRKGFMIQSSRTFTEVSGLESYSKYHVKIAAINNFGTSEFSDKYFFETGVTVPSAPTNVSFGFLDNNVDDSTVTAVLRWDPPCKLNGPFSHYLITIMGIKSGKIVYSKTVSSSVPNVTFDDLKIDAVYEVNVRAANSKFTSKARYFTFVHSTSTGKLFKFKYGGGPKGLFLDFNFGSGNVFSVGNCKFVLKETKTAEHKARNHKRQNSKQNLGGLAPCTKYDVMLKILNSATNKEFAYQNIVYTKMLSNVAKLVVAVDEANNESTILSWKIQSSKTNCITSYDVVIKNSKAEIVYDKSNVEDSSVVVKNLSPCELYTARVVAHSGRGEKITSNDKSFTIKSSVRSVENLELIVDEVTSETVALSWKTDSEDCLQEFHVKLRDNRDKIIYDKKVYSNSVVITNLTSCRNYSVELIALDSDKSALKAVIKSFFTPSTPIENVSINVSRTRADVSWVPSENLDCITNYQVGYEIVNCEHKPGDNVSCSTLRTIEKSKTSVRFSQLPLAERFTLTIYANEVTSNGDASRAKIWKFNTFDYEKFVVQNINEFRDKRTELQLSWGLDIYFKKLLKHFEVEFNGEVLITDKQSIIINIEACNKNYTISVRCVSKDDYKGAAVIYNTNLNDDDVPLSSLDSNINYKQVESSVMLTWNPKKEEINCIGFYEVEFNDQIVKTKETELEITDLAPCTSYEISITPISLHDIRGRTSIFELTTQEFPPQPPSELQLVKAGINDLMILTKISEDDKQCKSTVIEIMCNNLTVSLKIDVFEEKYVGQLTKLNPFSNYHCSARVINNVGKSKSTDSKVFKTTQDAPQPPFNIRSTSNDDGIINLRWDVNNSTGFAEEFLIEIVHEKTVNKEIKICHSNFTRRILLNSTENFVGVPPLEPFSIFQVQVKAVNSEGSSDFSEKHKFQTNVAIPTPPRNISVKFVTNNADDSTVTGIISWDPPCKLNGPFSLYLISLAASGKIINSKTKASSFTNVTFDDLKRGAVYEVKVQVANSKFTSESEIMTFDTPSGIPLKSDLKAWSTLGNTLHIFESGKFDIFIRRGVLHSDVGDIIGIAFMIFRSDCDEQPTISSGYLQSLDTKFPSAHEAGNNLECSVLYQQTEILPNPLDELKSSDNLWNEFNIKFTIGDEICSNSETEKRYCNGQLPVDYTYGIIARVFTKDAFRDTEPAFIAIRPNLLAKFPSHGIVYGSVGALILISFITLLCCLWSNGKKKKRIKMKQAAEADENLLSFTSYCVFDKNPLPRKKFTD
ncbi:CLUMA_CG007863, isoform A [Clunio marinus]|uniref:CLUMA_CG007863, isoform A n=1 Tax=Clunio marinus TaxID=568069 RepID=A0A1J1I233_9DIPT|nr:CLUMA_CG007863, isoform A [Clunio marinus]